MRHLASLSRERLPQALDLDQERTRGLYSIARTAAEIAESAIRLDAAIAHVSLSSDDRRVFSRYAETLRARADALSRRAPHMTRASLLSAAAGIEDTCVTCHRRFGGPNGQNGSKTP